MRELPTPLPFLLLPRDPKDWTLGAQEGGPFNKRTLTFPPETRMGGKSCTHVPGAAAGPRMLAGLVRWPSGSAHPRWPPGDWSSWSDVTAVRTLRLCCGNRVEGRSKQRDRWKGGRRRRAWVRQVGAADSAAAAADPAVAAAAAGDDARAGTELRHRRWRRPLGSSGFGGTCLSSLVGFLDAGERETRFGPLS